MSVRPITSLSSAPATGRRELARFSDESSAIPARDSDGLARARRRGEAVGEQARRKPAIESRPGVREAFALRYPPTAAIEKPRGLGFAPRLLGCLDRLAAM